MLKVVLANPRGFCAGVVMAVDVVDQVLDSCPEMRPIYVYHEIVHNRHIVNRLKSRGVVFVDTIEEVPEGSIVVFSAHGISPEIRRISNDRNLTAIDATGPLVTKVHMEAIRYAKAGYQILLIGHEGHDEVVGTVGEAPDAIQVIESPAGIANLNIHDPNRLTYLTQTTLSLHDASVIISALKKAFPAIKAPPSDDICYATTNRQLVVQQVAPTCDLVLVVGSMNSSNSQRLREIAESCGTTSYLIDDVNSLQSIWFDDIESVMVTSGASAPEDLVRALLLHLITHHDATIQQVDMFNETIEFAPPGSLKNLLRSRNITPADRSRRHDLGEEIEAWVTNQGGAPAGEPIRLTVSASGQGSSS